jgi:hypothetical protein
MSIRAGRLAYDEANAAAQTRLLSQLRQRGLERP